MSEHTDTIAPSDEDAVGLPARALARAHAQVAALEQLLAVYEQASLDVELQRDRALADAKAARERLYEVFMQAPAAITVLEGPEHVFTVSNPLYQQLTGNRELLGKSVRDALPELEGQGFYELLDQVYESGEPYSARETLVRLEHEGERKDLYLDFVYQPLKEADGRVFGIMAHAVDVTGPVLARKEIEQKADELARLTRELERSNRELDQFAYVASHDLKAPLRGIANLAQWIEEDLADRVAGETKEHMQLLKGRVNRMEALIDGVLAYSRAGRVREKPQLVDVRALVADVLELLAPPAEIDIAVGPEWPTLETERVPLQQVFMNLIGNAIKHNRTPGARIEIGAQRRDDSFEFSIADNGPGIAPQHHDKIWQIFQTLAARDKVEGTGIGLSVVRKIVEARGGQAWLDSDVGRGATFYFTWPERPRNTP
jgi:PAS domain S-box-containing protein